VLDIGVLVIAWYKAWRALNLLAFAFTFGIGAIWGAEGYRPSISRRPSRSWSRSSCST
jgi:uncharacterized membrane protein